MKNEKTVYFQQTNIGLKLIVNNKVNHKIWVLTWLLLKYLFGGLHTRPSLYREDQINLFDELV